MQENDFSHHFVAGENWKLERRAKNSFVWFSNRLSIVTHLGNKQLVSETVRLLLQQLNECQKRKMLKKKIETNWGIFYWKNMKMLHKRTEKNSEMLTWALLPRGFWTNEIKNIDLHRKGKRVSKLWKKIK